ncbi:PoNe immunity protein domain-containing protein [Pseudomonas sp. RL_35y_Pfl2_P42]|uniref:PoNe immunity protein domain-containing protein n=1 Tax=Pseudomonas sp. RL_35y_Pfl2_P42 TaxID=3088710 RepID=UPI0030D938DA
MLCKVLPGRHDIEQWYHDVYSPLVQAIYSETAEEATQHLKNYCSHWYTAFKQAPWHDTHHQGEDGNYVSYWAIEAGAIAFFVRHRRQQNRSYGLPERLGSVRTKQSSEIRVPGC